MNGLKENLLNLDTWLRLLLICVFMVVRWVLLIVINLLIAVQFLFVLFTGEKSTDIDAVSGMMNAYLLQIVNYQSFVSDKQPWPFSEFPESSRDLDEVIFIDD